MNNTKSTWPQHVWRSASCSEWEEPRWRARSADRWSCRTKAASSSMASRPPSSHPGTPAFSAPVPGTITVNQMYVQYRIPKTITGPAIVMVHGSGHTGATFETTPDGREGWATYFARKGFPVYVVDHAGRGRSGFDPTLINRTRAGEAEAKALPDFQIAPRERAWYFFRIGKTYPTPFPGSQFPVEVFDHYTSQLVPNTEAALPGAGANTVRRWAHCSTRSVRRS